MALEITKTFVVKAPPAAVWDFLTDVHRVARCMPGAAVGEKLDDKTFTGTMTVKVGPVSSTYKGKIVFERLDPVSRTAEIVATGQDVRGKGGADMRLTSTLREVAPGQTEVTAVSKVNVTGILAQMGRGMIQDVSDQLFQVFSQRMRDELESTATATSTSTQTATSTAPGTPTALANANTTATSTPSSTAPEALDIGAIGAKAAGRAAGRTLQKPAFWIGAIAITALLYFLFR